MFYDSIRNEWNICEEWAPNTRVPFEDNYEFDDGDDYLIPWQSPLSMSSRNRNTEHHWHDHCVDDNEDKETLHLSTHALLDVLKVHFSFLAMSTDPSHEPKLNWDMTRRTLVDQTRDVPSHMHRRVLAFVSLIAFNDIPSLHSDTWDLTCDYAQWAAAKFFKLQKDVVDRQAWYTIMSINGPHEPWQLAVSSARTALHCF